jgi:hypothetical protein
MPFDGATFSPEQRILRSLVEWYEHDDTWLRGDYSDGQGRACIYGAMRRIIRSCKPSKHYAYRYLSRAILQHYRSGRIDHFNDCICSSIEELRETVQFAYALACTFPPDGLPKPPAKRLPWRSGGMPDTRRLRPPVPRAGPRQLALPL